MGRFQDVEGASEAGEEQLQTATRARTPLQKTSKSRRSSETANLTPVPYNSHHTDLLAKYVDLSVIRGKKIIYISMVWGKLYWKYIQPYCEHMNEVFFGASNKNNHSDEKNNDSEYLLFLHDEESYQECLAAGGSSGNASDESDPTASKNDASTNTSACTMNFDTHTNAFQHKPPPRKVRCVRGFSKALGKLSLALALLNFNFEIVYVDFDSYILTNPTDLIRQTAKTRNVDVLVGGSFMDDCINNGFFYLKPTYLVREWFGKLFTFVYENPHIVDQKAMSAFLGYSSIPEDARVPEYVSRAFENQLARRVLLGKTPKWAPMNGSQWANSFYYLDRYGGPNERVSDGGRSNANTNSNTKSPKISFSFQPNIDAKPDEKAGSYGDFKAGLKRQLQMYNEKRNEKRGGGHKSTDKNPGRNTINGASNSMVQEGFQDQIFVMHFEYGGWVTEDVIENNKRWLRKHLTGSESVEEVRIMDMISFRYLL
jgi:hypothetical protein